MWSPRMMYLLLLVLLAWHATAAPALHHEESLPDLSRVAMAARVSPRLSMTDPRLPLPTPQELEAIRKVAQILVMLGEQVIPAIIGESSGTCCDPSALGDTNYDQVDT